MKKGFAPAAVLVLLLLVAGLGLAVTRVTNLQNVFQKPKAAGQEITCQVIDGPTSVKSGETVRYSFGIPQGGNKAQLWYIPTWAKDQQALWKQIGGDCPGTTCVQEFQFPKDDSYYVVCNAYNDSAGTKCSGNPFLPLPAGWGQCGGQSRLEVKVGNTVVPPPVTSGNKSCVVTLSSDTIPAGSLVQIKYNSSVISNSQNVRLWLEKWPDGATLSPAPATVTENDGSHVYYQLGTCPANGAECQANFQGTTAGPYYIHCDLPDEPNKCSGNPFCSYKGLGGTLDCNQWGWQSCSGIDVRKLTLTDAQSIFPNPNSTGGGGSCNPGQHQSNPNCPGDPSKDRVCGSDSQWPGGYPNCGNNNGGTVCTPNTEGPSCGKCWDNSTPKRYCNADGKGFGSCPACPPKPSGGGGDCVLGTHRACQKICPNYGNQGSQECVGNPAHWTSCQTPPDCGPARVCSPGQTRRCPSVVCPDGITYDSWQDCTEAGQWGGRCGTTGDCPKSSAPANGNSPAGTVYEGER